ncbi:FtsX-like permease family protein [Evansella cellulosilytica]|uniref:ABC3 transporter permease C-terminal domain-containing protein n=1 Tax=Evansella cellulosilytica (strain ATCC 21833 / DSM 2522 / FERM P-1141 / JCM 9156 / N-4) TaxID=649639 RepID=E6TXI9_EVAC2|nr:FtsX-like permease family protein [Evansella cellulosilytica]ADU28803.1 protein of unknown function DUF214 [Evansella cellulosilytica DSM 2522]
MTIFKIIARKMLNNRWLTFSLFLGLLITVSLVSSIPTYTTAVMDKMLVSGFEEFYEKEETFPSTFSYSINLARDESIDRTEMLEEMEVLQESLIESTNIPTARDVTILSTSRLRVILAGDTEEEILTSGRVIALTDIEDHITITDGTLPSNRMEDGVIEAIVPERALTTRQMVLGNTFTIGEGEDAFKIKPVGTFTADSPRDPYWIVSAERYNSDFIILEDVYREEIVHNRELVETVRFVSAFDYTAIQSEHIPTLLSLDPIVKREVNRMMDTILLIDFEVEEILKTYNTQSAQLETVLWSLIAPVLIMLAIYLFMVSRLIINRQLNEIAVFASRGAKRIQILFIYFIEITILGTIAFFVGPYLGLLYANILGATNGFLEFVQRTALPTQVLPESFLYGFYAILASIMMVMIPVFVASKKSIVNHKQNLAASVNQYKWYSIFIDLSLIGVSIYGLYTFQRGQAVSGSSGEIYIDPTLFFLPAIFIIGFGLLLLRIYPLILKAIYKLGEKIWSISLYSTFLQVSRSSKQYQFFMMFLIMTIAIGVFSASAARTINTNLEEQILYETGADVALEVLWDYEVRDPDPMNVNARAPVSESNDEEEEGFEREGTTGVREVMYTEPPFEPFENLIGVEQATRVFQKEDVRAEGNGQRMPSVQLMGIEPKQFGETAWFKGNILPHHWYEYLNLLSAEPSSVLISSSVARSLGVQEGDYITLSWSESDTGQFVVYGIIDYWPSFNPNAQGGDNTPALVVANLPYVQNVMALEPYHVWLSVDENTSRSDLYQNIRDERLRVFRMHDVQPQIVELKNSGFLLGLNGTLSLGFIISIVITFIGFLLYWIVTIKSRTMQYGIYRAMGIPMRDLIGIIIWEQVMTSGVACFLGIIIGGITSQLFVPLLQYSFDSHTLAPPFRVVFDSSDEMKIYAFVGFMFIVGLSILVALLRKIKVHQAIKLGED